MYWFCRSKIKFSLLSLISKKMTYEFILRSFKHPSHSDDLSSVFIKTLSTTRYCVTTGPRHILRVTTGLFLLHSFAWCFSTGSFLSFIFKILWRTSEISDCRQKKISKKLEEADGRMLVEDAYRSKNMLSRF